MSAKLPILMYHDIQSDNATLNRNDIGNRPYILDVEQFQSQMSFLYANGYKTIGLKDFLDYKEQKRTIPDKAIIISFDDGHISNYTHAYPIMQQYGFMAIFFITVCFVDKSDMLTWKQIQEMVDNGMEIGSHTLTHPFPSQLTDEELRYELSESKRILEEHLNREIAFLSSPTGYYNKSIESIAKEVGYKGVCISKIGGNDINANPFSLKRIVIKRNHDLHMFKSFIELKPRNLFYHRTGQIFRDISRKSLGLKGHEFIRKRLLYLTNIR